MNIINNVKQISEKVKDKIMRVFDKTSLNNLARKTGFIKRSTVKAEGEDFVKLMTTEIIGEDAVSTEGLCDILRQINPEADMTPQSLNERINRKESVEYLKEVFEAAFRENLEPVRSAISPALLSPFGRVFIEDSTAITLNEKLADEFRGSGGSASRSAVKIDITYEVKQDIIQNILIKNGNDSDLSEAETILTGLRENDLILRDLGYFTLKSLREISGKRAFFLSRMLKGVNVYLSADKDAEAIDLTEFIDKKFGFLPVSDINVYIGKEERLPCRLIAYRLPDDTVAERIRKARGNTQKKGRQLTEEYLNWLRFNIFITNISCEILEAESVGTVYRLRWQIEITFKHWKSLLKINIMRGIRRERVECFLYGRLTVIVILTMICGYASWYAYNYLKKEASFHKLINWLKRKDRLSDAVRSGCVEALFEELREISGTLCKQKRKRKTTRQLLEERIPYMESFLPDYVENRDSDPILLKKAV